MNTSPHLLENREESDERGRRRTSSTRQPTAPPDQQRMYYMELLPRVEPTPTAGGSSSTATGSPTVQQVGRRFGRRELMAVVLRSIDVRVVDVIFLLCVRVRIGRCIGKKCKHVFGEITPA